MAIFIYIPNSSIQEFHFLQIVTNILFGYGIVFYFLIIIIIMGEGLILVLIYISLIINTVENIFVFLLLIHFLWRNILYKSLLTFNLLCSLLTLGVVLYFLDINCLSNKWFSTILFIVFFYLDSLIWCPNF